MEWNPLSVRHGWFAVRLTANLLSRLRYSEAIQDQVDAAVNTFAARFGRLCPVPCAGGGGLQALAVDSDVRAIVTCWAAVAACRYCRGTALKRRRAVVTAGNTGRGEESLMSDGGGQALMGTSLSVFWLAMDIGQAG
jgi:hypothetical protein